LCTPASTNQGLKTLFAYAQKKLYEPVQIRLNQRAFSKQTQKRNAIDIPISKKPGLFPDRVSHLISPCQSATPGALFASSVSGCSSAINA
jgi:hypothetical protein